MWWTWVLVFLVAFVVVVLMSVRHRGSRGSSRHLDQSSGYSRNSPADHSYPTGVGDAGGGSGGN